jgi:Flp pilus assembly protein TadG
MFKRLSAFVSRFERSDKGAVAIIFALMSLTLFLIGGVAVDYARIVDMRDRVTNAVDSASLAAGRAMLEGKLSDDEISTLAEANFDRDVARARNMGTIDAPQVRIDRATGKVSIAVTAKVSMTISRVGGFTVISIPVTSTAVYQRRNIEVGIALDITKSMDDPANGTPMPQAG